MPFSFGLSSSRYFRILSMQECFRPSRLNGVESITSVFIVIAICKTFLLKSRTADCCYREWWAACRACFYPTGEHFISQLATQSKISPVNNSNNPLDCEAVIVLGILMGSKIDQIIYNFKRMSLNRVLCISLLRLKKAVLQEQFLRHTSYAGSSSNLCFCFLMLYQQMQGPTDEVTNLYYKNI